MSCPNKATACSSPRRECERTKRKLRECRDGLPGSRLEGENENARERWNEQERTPAVSCIVFLSFSIFALSSFLHLLVFLFFFLFFLFFLTLFLAMHRNSLKVVLKRGDDTTTAYLKDKWYFLWCFVITLTLNYFILQKKIIFSEIIFNSYVNNNRFIFWKESSCLNWLIKD